MNNVDIIRAVLNALPQRVAMSFYHRVLAKRKSRFPAAFESAPLKAAPGMRMRLCPTDSFHGQVAFLGVYEHAVTQIVSDAARRGGLLVDVGANWGYYTLIWCAQNRTNQVAAIEASPRNLSALSHNVEHNNLLGRVEVFPWAASSSDGELSFCTGGVEETGWGGIAAGEPPVNEVLTVACHKLDSAFPNGDIAMLKIDCEGADALVIEGARQLFETRRIKAAVFEENLARQNALGIAPGTAAAMLRSFGYQVTPIGNDVGLQNFHAVCE